MNTRQALGQLESAVAEHRLSSSAAANIRNWLTEPRYSQYAPKVQEHIAQGMWQQLDDVFWTVIPFGTGGRRGRMYPIGSNAINDRTIGESAQGLADYVDNRPARRCTAWFLRHRLRHASSLAAFRRIVCRRSWWRPASRSTFSTAIAARPNCPSWSRYKQCSCGIMVTASHNPPSDNAVKVYWSTGGQVLPPHDKAIIDRVMNVEEIAHADFASSRSTG